LTEKESSWYNSEPGMVLYFYNAPQIFNWNHLFSCGLGPNILENISAESLLPFAAG
jgi:hypothetical protein